MIITTMIMTTTITLQHHRNMIFLTIVLIIMMTLLVMTLQLHVCPSQEPLDSPPSSLLPSAESVNLNPDKELIAMPMSDTACLDTKGNECTSPAESLEAKTYLLLPHYAGIVLPPLTNTVFTLNDARFKHK